MSQPVQPFAPIDFKSRFPALDGIRALAVTMVFLHHFGGGAHGGPLLRVLNIVREQFGAGVDFFFVLSGFLITGILFDTRHDSHFFKRFFARRSVRIFPVFYLTVVVLLMLTPFMHYEWHWGHLLFLVYMGNFLANYDFSLYTINSASHPTFIIWISHFWSLCVEEQFYLVWPLVVWMVRDRVKLLRTAIAISVFALVLRYLMLWIAGPATGETWIGRTLFFRADALLIGGILALLLRGPNADRWQRLCAPVLFVSTALFIGILMLPSHIEQFWFLTVGLTLTSLMGAGMIGAALRPASFAFRLFYFKPLRILGKYSYGFYIFHLIFGWAWISLLGFLIAHHFSRGLSGLFTLSANFFLTFLIAKLSYDHFEVKFLRLKRHFEYDSEIVEHKHAFTTK